MSTARDFTPRQFAAALERHGIKPAGFLGYYTLPNGVKVSVLNTGSERRRTWLAYLLQQQDALRKSGIP